MVARALVVLFLAVAPAAPADLPGPSAELAARTDAIFAEFDRPGRPGCALGVMRGGELAYARGYGLASLEWDVPITPQTVFDIASISKQFAAAVTILLAMDGKLSLDDEVRKWIPELPDYGKRITIRHLLHHTSGLRDTGGLFALAGMTEEDAVADDGVLAMVVRQRRLNHDPGTEFVYCNTGYFMLSLVAKRAAGKTLRILAEERITVWYTAPTAIRMLMRAGAGLARRHDLSALRFAASVGEPLNPEAVVWGLEAIGMPFHDNWWQTETGGIMIANFPAMEVRPGSMGKPLPGVDAAIVQRDRDGEVTVIDEPGVQGELALRRGWPSMFRGYLGEEQRYAACFSADWYLTGDLARRDADGYYWFVGRGDDVIKSAGHLIGPFEVESALMEHPAVAEAGVIGVPDPVAGELVKAFVALRPGFAAGEELRRSLLAHARRRLGPAVAPRTIEFTASLPRTRSGKIMRRLLRARELGLPEGDLSTLEEAR